MIAGAVAMMIGLMLLVQRTKLGKAMRATSYDREAAAMMGIDVDRVIASTFFIGSALAGAAGVLVGLVFGQINHFMGFTYGLKGFTAAVVGGIGSIPGAMLGGLPIGLAEAYTVGYVTSRSATSSVLDPDPFLLVRPHGSSASRTSGRSDERLHPRDAAERPRRARRSAATSGSPARGRTSSGSAAPASPRASRSCRRVRYGVLLAPIVALPLLTGSDYLIQVGIDTFLYVLLALGLNIAVGLADCSTSATSPSTPSGLRLRPAGLGAVRPSLGAQWRSRPSSITMVVGFLLGLPSWRVSGDYLAIATLFFLQISSTLLNNVDRPTSTSSTSPRSGDHQGPNGISTVDPLSFFGRTLGSLDAYYCRSPGRW